MMTTVPATLQPAIGRARNAADCSTSPMRPTPPNGRTATIARLDVATYRATIDGTDQDPRCDDCSTFHDDGFATDDRSWTPIYGAPCSECGEPA